MGCIMTRLAIASQQNAVIVQSCRRSTQKVTESMHESNGAGRGMRREELIDLFMSGLREHSLAIPRVVWLSPQSEDTMVKLSSKRATSGNVEWEA